MRERHLGMLRREDLQQRNPFDGLAEMSEGDNYRHLTVGQRARLRGFAGFLTLANSGIQWRDFDKRDKGLGDREKSFEARALVVKALYTILYPQELVPYRVPKDKKLTVQSTVVDFREIVYAVCDKASLSPKESEKIPQLVTFMRILSDQWVPKQA